MIWRPCYQRKKHQLSLQYSTSPIVICGKTTDGRFVVNSVFRFFGTDGIPLDVVFEFFKTHDCIPDWPDLVREAMLAGMRFERILSLLDAAIADSYGPGLRDVVIARLKADHRG